MAEEDNIFYEKDDASPSSTKVQEAFTPKPNNPTAT
jgi:hypothetical protein